MTIFTNFLSQWEKKRSKHCFRDWFSWMNQILYIIYCSSWFVKVHCSDCSLYVFSITSTCLRHLDENLNVFHLRSTFYHPRVIHGFKNRKQKFWTRLQLAFLTHAGPDFPPRHPSQLQSMQSSDCKEYYTKISPGQRCGKKEEILYALFDMKWVFPAQGSA